MTQQSAPPEPAGKPTKGLRQAIATRVQFLRWYRYKLAGYDIHRSCEIERGLNLDRYFPQGIHVGAHTILTSRVTILSHKLIPRKSLGRYDGEKVHTYIGEWCVIGIGAVIMGGVRIGDECVIGAGAVITKDVPSGSIVAGNPARVVREGITMEGISL
ncbi:MAG: DapH/DapD/GlmU-related protein [Pseudomonadota bacterium]